MARSQSSDRGSGRSHTPSGYPSSYRKDDESRAVGLRVRTRELAVMSDPIARAQGFLDFARDLTPGEFTGLIYIWIPDFSEKLLQRR